VSVSDTIAETKIVMDKGDGELAEQAADDAAHQQQRDQHGDQRDADRHDREGISPEPFIAASSGSSPSSRVARDIFQHHDRVIDHEADPRS